MNKFPSYRFHPEGHMALIFSDDECKALPQWLQTPPEDFNCPAVAHFHGLEQVPAYLQGGPMEELPDENKEVPGENKEVPGETPEETKARKQAFAEEVTTKASLVARLNKIKGNK